MVQEAKYATAAPEAPDGAQAHNSAQRLDEPKKTLPAASPQAPTAKPKLWENSVDSPKGLNFQPEAELHAKMNWVCDNLPKMSRLRILREGATMLCDQLIAMHYRGKNERCTIQICYDYLKTVDAAGFARLHSCTLA